MSGPFNLSGISDERLDELRTSLIDMRKACEQFPGATMRIRLEISALKDAIEIETWRRPYAKTVT